MGRERNYSTKAARDSLVSQVGRCELCGSKRGLEVHHIVPLCINTRIDLDVEDNWIVVCRKCHGLLTPHGILTKIGIEKINIHADPVVKFYETCDEQQPRSAVEVLDIFDEIFLKN